MRAVPMNATMTAGVNRPDHEFGPKISVAVRRRQDEECLSVHVALAGPCFAQDLADLWDRWSAARGVPVPGPRAVPVSRLHAPVADGHQVTIVSLTLDEPGGAQESRARGSAWSDSVLGAAHGIIFATLRIGADRRRRDPAGFGTDIVNAHWTSEYELAAQDRQSPHVPTAHDSPSTVLRRMPDAYRLARLVVAERAIRRTQHLCRLPLSGQ